jgi:hypothetical protein
LSATHNPLLRGFIRDDLLQLGAPGRLLMAGELDAVLPADDAKLLDAGDPVKGDKIEFNPQAVEARERATVKLLLTGTESPIDRRWNAVFVRRGQGSPPSSPNRDGRRRQIETGKQQRSSIPTRMASPLIRFAKRPFRSGPNPAEVFLCKC